jgi:hypothetical protein
MTAPARFGLKLVASLFAAALLVYIALLFFVRSSAFRDWMQTELSRRSGLQVRLTDLTLQPPLRLSAGPLEVSQPGGFLLRAARVTLSLTPLDLLLQTAGGIYAEEPVLEIAIEEMMKPSSRSAARVGIRYLNVKDGSIVLLKSGAAVLRLPNIDLEASNLNVGQTSGIQLQADVPPLNGEAQLQLSAQPAALDAELVVRAKTTGLFRRGEEYKNSAMMRLNAKIRTAENHGVTAALDGELKNLLVAERRFSGSLNASGAIDGGWNDLDVSGRLLLLDVKQALGPVAARLPQANVAADFAASYSLAGKTLALRSFAMDSSLGKGSASGAAVFDPEPRISRAQISWSGIPLDALRPALPAPLNEWTIQGVGSLDLEVGGPFKRLSAKGAARSEGANVAGRNLSLADLTFTVPFEWASPQIAIKEAQVSASKLVYGGKGGWQAAANRVQVGASTALPAANGLKVTGSLEAGGGKFSSPDNNRIGENLTVRGPFELTWTGVDSAMKIAGKFSADAGEILWDSFFSNLKAPRPEFEVDADYSAAADRLDCRRCALALRAIGTVEAVGSVERVTQSAEFGLTARGSGILPGGLFETFVRENLNRQYPVLDKLILGGDLSFEARLRGELKSLTVGGQISLKDGEARSKSNDWQIGPMALDLPFLLTWPEGQKSPTQQPRAGTFAIDRMRFGQTQVGSVSAPLSLFNNELRFHQPLRAAVFEGEVILGNLRWRDVLADPKQLSFSFEAKRLQLQALTEALGWPPFSGTLTGTIPEVQSTTNVLRTKGEIQAEIFGGRVRMSRLEIENPFSSLRAVRLDAALRNIDLEQLSKTFAFGRISGILEGAIGDLIIVDGQPAQFGADLHSVDRGGEQRISVEALDKITVLSSGQSAGGLYGGLAGFFDSFRYSKLGFKAILKNDRLTLRGVESRDNQEYLVVGSFLPPTVNVVSHTQTIAFSDLLRRLERVKSDKPKVQ